MPAKTYQKQMEETIQALPKRPKPTLLLHVCCAPCSSYVLESLSEHFKITVLYYNPNIYPDTEYNRRLEELKAFSKKFPVFSKKKIKLVECKYDPEEFYNAVGTRDNIGLAIQPECGERCRRCYEFRMRYAYEFARENNFDYFCTSLSISPHKDADKINTIGIDLQNSNPDGPKWLVSDFKKKNGFKRSLELSKEYDLYRQEYCGCIYSMNNSEIHNFAIFF